MTKKEMNEIIEDLLNSIGVHVACPGCGENVTVDYENLTATCSRCNSSGKFKWVWKAPEIKN